MQYPLCRHIHTNGVQCGSPALAERLHCYFHDRFYQRHSGFRFTERTRGYLLPGKDIELVPLEDHNSIQTALSVVINALATGNLETRRATALLYGLQIASANSSRLNWSSTPSETVVTAETTAEGLDLAEPGAIYEDPPLLTWSNEDEENEEDGETD